MNTPLIGFIAGVVLGVSCAGVVTLYLFWTRSLRIAGSQYAIRFGQFLGGGLFLGSLLLLLKLCERIGIVVHAPGYDQALGAYLFGFVSVTFFALRAETRWRKSRGIGQTGKPADSTTRLTLTPLKRNFLVILMFGVGLGIPAGFMMRRQEPASLYLGAMSWLCFFAILVLVAGLRDRAHAVQTGKVILVAFACIEIAMLALFWKYRASSPTFSSAALAAAVMLCVGTAGEFAVLRRTIRRN